MILKAFTLISNGLGANFDTILFVIILCGCLILYYKGFLAGISMTFFIMGLTFVFYYLQGYNYLYPLITMLVSLVIMSLTLYITNKTAQAGGFV